MHLELRSEMCALTDLLKPSPYFLTAARIRDGESRTPVEWTDLRCSCEEARPCFGIAVMSSSPAFADTFGGPPGAGGATAGDSFFVRIIGAGQTGGSGSVSAGDPNGPAPYRYTWVPGGVFGGRGPSCDVGFGQPGWLHTLVVTELSGAIVNQEVRCLALNPDGSVPAPPAAPPVPSIGEIWRAALRQIPPPKIGINPRPTRLTGLEPRPWYEGPEELQVSTSIGPWTVTGTARVQDVVFEMGEGRSARADRAGSASD